MVVITVIPLGKLKAPPAFTELQLLQKSYVRKQAKRPIDGGQRNLHLQGGQLLMHLLRTQVAAGSAMFEQFEDPFSLGCQTTTIIMQALL